MLRCPGRGADLRRHALLRRPARCRSTAGGSFADGTSSFGGTFGYGTPKSFYGKAGLGTTSYDGFDGSSFDLSVGGGYQIALKSQRHGRALPGRQPEHRLGPERHRSAPAWTCRAGPSRSARRVGAPASGNNPQVQILPNASFQFANTRLSLDDGTDSASGSESYGLLTLGTGFVFNSRYSLNPSISIPMGLDGSGASFRSRGRSTSGAEPRGSFVVASRSRVAWNHAALDRFYAPSANSPRRSLTHHAPVRRRSSGVLNR